MYLASASLLESDTGKGIEHGPCAALMCSFHIMYMKTWPLGLWCEKRATGPGGADTEPLEETEAPGKSTHYHDAQKLIALV